MRTTGIGTSLMLIAVGAVLAFAVDLQTTGVDLNVIGAILMVVGIIGLIFSFIALGEFSGFGYGGTVHDTGHYDVTPDHERPLPPTDEVVREERIRRY